MVEYNELLNLAKKYRKAIDALKNLVNAYEAHDKIRWEGPAGSFKTFEKAIGRAKVVLGRVKEAGDA